ncbi:probable glutathione S-transferase [Cajanus cajan]|uniref:glutathione transferase n=1 Tax=Cajanus cajan TaxID=3821 RepID=A0A151SSF6_CAJCA|nr:probable glutathione S-transferase [Cajanus cajan]KYP57760.1 putative glutathione S-transferase [Cajanus cajan]
MGDEVVLLDFGLSMFCIRVKIALAEKGVKYEMKEEDLVNTKSPLLLQSNPVHKKVPVLLHNGKPISESLIILEYIDEFWKDKAPLLPIDPYHRSQARFWADFVDNKVHEVAKKIWTGKVDEHEAEKKELIENLKQLEEALGDKPYFGGETFGFVDIALIPFYKWFSTYEKVGKFKLDYPKLVVWANRCFERESVSQFISDEKDVYDFVLSHRKRLGVD